MRIPSWLYGRSAGAEHRLLAWPVALLLVLAVHVAAGILILQLRFNNSPEVYYPDGSAAVELRSALRSEFPSDEVLTVVFQGKDLYTKDFLTRLDRAAASLQKHPLVDRVLTVTTMERISGASDGFSVERLIDPGRLRNETPEALKQRVLSDRFAPGLLASRDGLLLALAVRPKTLNESSERLALKIATATAINEAGLRGHYAGDAGPVTVDVAQLQSILSDTMTFVPLTAALGLGLLGWVVGRWRPVVIGAVAMSTVILPTIAGVAVSGNPYTMASAILPSLLAAYTLATLLHLYAAFQRAQSAGLSRAMCVDRAISETRKPGAFNVLTTGAGLLSMVLVPIPPVRVFGVAGAVGTLFVFLTVYFLVPPFLARWDKQRWPKRGGGMKSLGRIASRITLTSMRHPKAMVMGALAIVLVVFPLTLKVTVESDVLAFFKPEHPVSRHTQLVESKLAGVTSLEISLVGEGRDSLQNMATMRAIRDFQRWLEALPEVDRSVSMVDLVEQMHWAMNGEKPAFQALPATDRLLRQYLLVYDGTDLYELVNRDFEHARIVLNMNIHGAKKIGATIDQIRERLATHPIPGLKVDIGGFGRLFADQIDSLVSGQINSFAGSFLQIFFFMALLFRSPSAAALCILPNLAPLYFILVLMGGAGIPLDLATVMIAGVVLGITVDDTIHLYHGYQHRRQRGISPILAIARSFESAGRAVLAISLVLTAQFALLATSDFIPTANFGLMTVFGLLSGQLAELLLLPALLVLKDGSQKKQAPRARPAVPAEDTEDTELAETDDAWEPTRLLERPPAMAPAHKVLVCQGDACQAHGAADIWRQLSRELGSSGAAGAAGAGPLVKTGCLGLCESAPVVQVVPVTSSTGVAIAADRSQWLVAVKARLQTLEAPAAHPPAQPEPPGAPVTSAKPLI